MTSEWFPSKLFSIRPNVRAEWWKDKTFPAKMLHSFVTKRAVWRRCVCVCVAGGGGFVGLCDNYHIIFG
jgi:hypothetical protein